MINEISGCLTVIISVLSAIAAIFAAIAAWKSSQTAKSALKLQKVLVTHKHEVKLLSNLIEKLIELNTFTKYNVLEMSDEKFSSAGKLISDINETIINIRSVSSDMDKDIEEWSALKNENGISMKQTLETQLDVEVLSVINENTDFFQSRIDKVKKMRESFLL